MFELREKTLRKYFPDSQGTNLTAILSEFPVEKPQNIPEECYNILHKHFHENKIRKQDYEFLKENLDNIPPEFASYICLKFKHKVCSEDECLHYIGLIDGKKYLSYYVSYISVYSISKKKCDDEEAYSIYHELFSKKGKYQDYVSASFYCLEQHFDPVIMEVYVEKHKPLKIFNLVNYVTTFCTFFDIKHIEKAFNLDSPKWKACLRDLRKKYI